MIQPSDSSPDSDDFPTRSRPWPLIALIVALALGSILYRLLQWGELKETSALFIGLPALLAIVVALMPKARSIQGVIAKTITLFLLLSGIVLSEGFICIAMAAPLFYLVGAIIGLIYKRRTRAVRERAGRLPTLWVAPLILLLSLEGTHEDLSFSRAETVTVERTVAASAAQVERRLSAPLRFVEPLPLFLQIGFPTPTAIRGDGLIVGDRRTVRFGDADGSQLVMEVVESRPGAVRFRMVSDGTPIGGWLTWKEALVEWRTVGADRAVVRWTLSYDRGLDPVWYFGPLERYGVGRAAEYLISTLGGAVE